MCPTPIQPSDKGSFFHKPNILKALAKTPILGRLIRAVLPANHPFSQTAYKTNKFQKEVTSLNKKVIQDLKDRKFNQIFENKNIPKNELRSEVEKALKMRRKDHKKNDKLEHKLNSQRGAIGFPHTQLNPGIHEMIQKNNETHFLLDLADILDNYVLDLNGDERLFEIDFLAELETMLVDIAPEYQEKGLLQSEDAKNIINEAEQIMKNQAEFATLQVLQIAQEELVQAMSSKKEPDKEMDRYKKALSDTLEHVPKLQKEGLLQSEEAKKRIDKAQKFLAQISEPTNKASDSDDID